MDDIIQHILAVEKQAQKLVEDSLAQARILIEDSRNQARADLENRRSQAQQEATEIAESSTKAAEDEKKQRLDEIRRNAPSAEDIAPELRSAAIQNAVKKIIGIKNNSA